MLSLLRALRAPRAHFVALAAMAFALAAAPRGADAFCGFYVSGSGEGLFNGATRVALMRFRTRTILSMSNDYQGPPQDFAMVVPVRVVLQRENVRTLPREVFDTLEAVTAPRLVEYWEQDPCAHHGGYRQTMAMPGTAAVAVAERALGDEERALHVRVEARFAVGEYDVVVLSAGESNGLETWLRRNGYNIPAGAAAVLAPYVREQWKFFVARVDIDRVERREAPPAAAGNEGAPRASATARLSPLRFYYDSPEFRLPVRLGLLNAGAAQDLIVYVLHPSSRFEAANYRNVFAPTNLRVAESVRPAFASFYAELFDATLASAGGRAVVTEYAWTTGSCDPCPVPPLSEQDVMTLGGDVLSADVRQEGETFARGHAAEDDEAAAGADDERGGAGAQRRLIDPETMVVTRLHTRYNNATLTEDLVFREAPPVVGGREGMGNEAGGVEQGAQLTTGANNYQARYIIRHEWQGPITCDDPRRGIWGGDPAQGYGGYGAPSVSPARELASAPRSAVNLPAVVLTPTPGVDLHARLALPPPRPLGALGVVGGGGPVRRGCACGAAIGARGAWSAGGAGVAAVVGVASVATGVRRRRRREQRAARR